MLIKIPHFDTTSAVAYIRSAYKLPKSATLEAWLDVDVIIVNVINAGKLIEVIRCIKLIR